MFFRLLLYGAIAYFIIRILRLAKGIGSSDSSWKSKDKPKTKPYSDSDIVDVSYTEVSSEDEPEKES